MATSRRAVAFTRGLKRDGSPMTSASSKKLKTGDDEVNVEAPSHGVPQEEAGATPSQNVSREEVAAPSHSQDIPDAQVEVPSQKATIEDVEVPSNFASTAQHTASSLKKVGTKKKRLGRKGVHTSPSTIPIAEGDPEAEHKVCLKYASDADSASDDDTPVNLYAVVDWELLPTGLGSINVFYRLDNSRKYFTSLREILHLVTRADLMTLYGRVMTFYQDKKAAGVGLVLWGDLKVLMDSPEVNDGSDVWKNQHTWRIQSWKLYSFSGVHVLETVSGLVLHMFVDKKYPLSVNLIERMLDHQLEICHGTVGNELTTAVQLIAFLKKQISDSKRPKVQSCVIDLRSCYNKEWLVQEGTALGKDFIKSVNGCDDLPKIIRLASPRVNGYLVKASSNPFLFFDSPLPGVNTPWDVMRIFSQSLSIVFVFLLLLDVALAAAHSPVSILKLTSEDLSRNLKYVVPTGRVNVPAGRYVVPTGKDNVIVSTGRTKVIPAEHILNETRAEQNLAEPSIESNVKYALEVGNNEWIMDEVISSDDDRDHTDSFMIIKPEIKIGDEFLKILHDSFFNGMDGGDVTGHIAKVLEITKWFKIPNVDKDELRLHVFSKSLSGDAEKWWNSERTSTTWKELGDKFFHKYYPLSHAYKSKLYTKATSNFN
ncbi:hypothetical protein Tco_0520728 [Tanacetum coccineum]